MKYRTVSRWLRATPHYENFPVASALFPAALRPPLLALYRFARYADDIADEGTASASERLDLLNQLDQALLGLAPAPAVIQQLHPHWTQHRLPVAPLQALLSAFKQDVIHDAHQAVYPDQQTVLDYCTRSANPIGELMLRLFGVWNRETRPYSDNICTALQGINFLQDLKRDWLRGRRYLPLRELRQSGLEIADVALSVRAGYCPAQLCKFLETQALQYQERLLMGIPLIRKVPLRLGWELRAIIAGGLQILSQLKQGAYDPVARRPVLGWRDAMGLLWKYWRLPV